MISSLVLAAWVAGGVAAPYRAASCARAEHTACCCGGAEQCHCRLSAQTPPASSSELSPPTRAAEPLGLPSVVRAVPEELAPAPSPIGSTVDAAFETVPPLYLRTHAFRC